MHPARKLVFSVGESTWTPSSGNTWLATTLMLSQSIVLSPRCCDPWLVTLVPRNSFSLVAEKTPACNTVTTIRILTEMVQRKLEVILQQ